MGIGFIKLPKGQGVARRKDGGGPIEGFGGGSLREDEPFAVLSSL